tara:strand:- start:2269 stop:4704 length:2436 start_codon:yes stop_codon:yes gene_type:complete
MYNNKSDQSGGFPDPLAPYEEKISKEYGLRYAKAIEGQWGSTDSTSSTYGGRKNIFARNRDYANGTQDTSIYKQLLNALDPNNGDGSLMNLDFTSVPILPKFVRVVVNKILSRNPYPNLEAVDPLSSSEKNREKNRIKNQIKLRPQLQKLKELTGEVLVGEDPDTLPETIEEAEILMDTNIKTDAEIAAQVATDMTLSWNNFEDNTFRRCVNDLAALGMSVVKRTNDSNYGIRVEYVDPVNFVHSYTDDPNLDDIVYAGCVREIPLQELKRLAGDQLTEQDLQKITKNAKRASSNRSMKAPYYPSKIDKSQYGGYTVEVLDFEFKSVDCMHFEEKQNRFGNTGFFFEGMKYKERTGSVYERTPHKMEVETVYSGMYILGTDHILNYGRTANVPKNIHDISRAKLSFSAVAVNLNDQLPKSMVDSCVGFADMLQLTHLKLQQAIAKAKPDGLVIDIEGLENVQLGKGGELQPLELHDIYEQTGVFYYRSKNPEGGFQNPPVREIGNSIRNINELIALYNHYLRMIRDTTGINEAVDASTPKSDALVGVREQAIAASNNATYDVTNAAMVLYKKVCQDVVKCLQILPPESVIFKAYENAIGETNMGVLSSFSDLPMYNFGVQVQREMEDKDRVYLEQNIQIALSQKELDLEDAMAVRAMKDVNQAEQLLMVRRKKRMKKQQEIAMQNSQMQSQQAQQAALVASQAKQQEMQMTAQLDAQKIQLETEAEIAIAKVKHEMQKEIEQLRIMNRSAEKGADQMARSQIEKQKDDRKDERVKKQAIEQSKLIAQRKGERGTLEEQVGAGFDISQLLQG